MTFSNTFITKKSTATASPAPPAVPSYAHGSCTLHIRQYQKHRANKNPSDTYNIEAFIYDSTHHIIDISNSGQLPAPEGKPIKVYGLADVVSITAQSVDSDPLTVEYQGATWKTNDKKDNGKKKCSTEAFENGIRDLECGLIANGRLERVLSGPPPIPTPPKYYFVLACITSRRKSPTSTRCFHADLTT